VEENKIIMGRPKDEKYWDEVCVEEDGRLKCKHCGVKFRGGVSRIKAHVDRIEGKGIRICSSLPNHITSSNHSQQHIDVITASQGTTIHYFSLSCLKVLNVFYLINPQNKL